MGNRSPRPADEPRQNNRDYCGGSLFTANGASPRPHSPGKSQMVGRTSFTKVENLCSRDLLEGFLQTARQDGYISVELHTDLLEAARNQSDDKAGSSKEKEVAASAPASNELLPGLGFQEEKTTAGHVAFWLAKGAKKRGSYDDYESYADPKVTKVLSSGVDCEAVLHDKSFNCLSRGNIEEDSCIVVYAFTQPVNFLGRFQMPGVKLNAWAQAIGKQYSDAPYHNWRHAFDVFQLSFLVLTDGGAADYFNRQDCFSIMIAAIAHDVGHAGSNNVFQVKARTALANMYNDKSPLENMHASLLFETLRKPDSNFLELLPSADFENVRTKIIDTILETDPSHHFPYVEKLKARMNKGPISKEKDVPEGDEDARKTNKDDRSLLLQGFVHMWDIGNGLRPWGVYKNLVASLEEEFFIQGDKEKQMGLPVTMMMDREKDRLAAGQGFFLGTLVLPLFDLYAKVMKEDLVEICRSNMEFNKKRWQDLIDTHGKIPVPEILALETPE